MLVLNCIGVYLGSLSYVRIYSGVINNGDVLLILVMDKGS